MEKNYDFKQSKIRRSVLFARKNKKIIALILFSIFMTVVITAYIFTRFKDNPTLVGLGAAFFVVSNLITRSLMKIAIL
jgi:hypothetical protein